MDQLKKSEEIRKYPETNENGNTVFQKSMECIKSSSKKEVYSDVFLKKQEKSRINNLTSKGIRKRRAKPKVSRSKKITKNFEDIDKIETKKQQKRSMNMRAIFCCCCFLRDKQN